MIAIAEPHRETLERYHRWFERDHMYSAVLIGPGAFAANRYVATRALKDLRYPRDGAVFARVDAGSFVALYFIAADRVEEHFEWSYAETARLGAAGRNDPNREIVLTWLCDYRGAASRDADSVPPEIALDHHPYAGLVMAWVECAATGSQDELHRWLRDVHLRAVLPGSAVDQVLVFAPREFPPPPGGEPPTPGTISTNASIGRGLVLTYFLKRDPAELWHPYFSGLGDALKAGGRGTLSFVAPFVPAVRGTTAHLDELW